MNSEDFDRVTVVLEPQSQTLLAIEPGNPLPTWVVAMAAVNPEYRNMIASAHLLYRVNRETRQGLELLIDLLEAPSVRIEFAYGGTMRDRRLAYHRAIAKIIVDTSYSPS